MRVRLSDAEFRYAIDNKTCMCGSREPRHELTDARGIFCTYVCDKCEVERRSEFRPDIFTDSQYPADDLGDDQC